MIRSFAAFGIVLHSWFKNGIVRAATDRERTPLLMGTAVRPLSLAALNAPVPRTFSCVTGSRDAGCGTASRTDYS